MSEPVSLGEPLGGDDVAIDVEGTQGGAVIGRVALAGGRAAAMLGRRVLAGPIDPCGECEVCRRGGAAVCPHARRREPGAAAGPRRIIAAARWLVPLDDGPASGEAATLEHGPGEPAGLTLPSPAGAAAAGDAAIAYTLYARTGLGAREPAVIVGASPIARFLVEILRAKGMTPVVVVDPAHAAWADWIAARGAGVARVEPGASDDDARAAVTAAIAAQGTGARPWRVLAAAPEAAQRAAALAGPRATLTLLAPVTALPGDLVAREVTVIGVAGAHPDLVVETAAMCVKGEIDLAGGTVSDPDEPNDTMRALVTPS